MKDFFKGVEKTKYEVPDSKNILSFKYYDADKMIMEKSMKDY